jgi:ATP-dependent protease HslVU (ClpYQ) peptidase subunit
MLEKKEEQKIFVEFEKCFEKWRENLLKLEAEMAQTKDFLETVKDKYLHQEQVALLFKTYQPLHTKDMKLTIELIRKTKKFLIAIDRHRSFGDDLFSDFKLKIDIETTTI